MEATNIEARRFSGECSAWARRSGRLGRSVDLPEYRIRAQCEAALWHCLCHHGQETEPTNCDKDTMPETITSNEERQYRHRNLYVQCALVVVAVVGIIVAICALRSLNHSVGVANRQAKAAATQAEVERRSQRASVNLGLPDAGGFQDDRPNLIEQLAPWNIACHKSAGLRPVRFAMRASSRV